MKLKITINDSEEYIRVITIETNTIPQIKDFGNIFSSVLNELTKSDEKE